MPAAAINPACRRPPPNALRTLLALCQLDLGLSCVSNREKKLNVAYLFMKSLAPATTDPMGAPSPLLRQMVTESHPETKSLGGTPRAAAALNNRAPSQCNGIPRVRQNEDTLEKP